MANTAYDKVQKPMGGIQNKLQDKLETQSEINDSAKRRQYKKYGMKEYNELKSNIQSQKMGGLGANIGSE